MSGSTWFYVGLGLAAVAALVVLVVAIVHYPRDNSF